MIDDAATLELKDGEGQTRIKLSVDREGRTQIEGLGPSPAAK